MQDVECYDFGAGPNPETDEDGSFWDYQWCTEQFQPFSKDGKHDMYWAQVPSHTHHHSTEHLSLLQSIGLKSSRSGQVLMAARAVPPQS